MIYALAPHAHLAIVDAEAVWLDLLQDAYLCVSARQLHRLSPDRVEIDDPVLAEGLAEAGLISPALSDQIPERRDLPQIAHRDLADRSLASMASAIPGRVLIASLWTQYRHRAAGSLSPLIAAAGRLGSPLVGQADPPGEATLALARRVNALQLWLPWPGQCVARSFLMINVLRRAGCPAAWVFGVQTWPFLAHCWVQSGDVALNDSAERLAGFQPIFVA